MVRLLPHLLGVRSWVTPERVFNSLDGRELAVAGSLQRVIVYGVIDERENRWVQVSIGESILTLRLTATQDPADAVRDLSSWLADPSTTSNVLAHTH